jgi:hypothetical protein
MLVACISLAATADAAVTVDRLYLFGDNSGDGNTENGADDIPVGSGAGNVSPGNTIDHVGPNGSFQDLLPAFCTGATCPTSNNLIPVYEDLTGLGRSGLGILFDGTDDFLRGFPLGFPPLSRGTINGGGSGTLNYNGVYNRGMQLWVYPHSGATAEQHIVSDTEVHGIRISSGGNWMLRHASANINSNVAVQFNEWSHVMAVMPIISQPHRAVLYVDGVAIAASEANYSTNGNVNSATLAELVVGANTRDLNDDGTAGTPASSGIQNFFRGVLDDLEMFVWGRGFNAATGTFSDFGTFNFATDNDYAASVLSGVAGDLDSDNDLEQDDIDDFVGGWLNSKTVNNIRIGDLETFAAGDLNFDGITNLTDAHLMKQAIGGAGGGGFDLSGFGAVTGIPEPSSLGLAAVALARLAVARRRRKN